MLRDRGGLVDSYMHDLALLIATIAAREAPVGPDENPIGEIRERTEPRLRDSIVVIPSRTAGGYEIRATASYAAAVHQGSRPHEIKPKRATLLRFAVAERKSTGEPGLVFAKRVQHPGHPQGNPFLLRALRQALR